MLVVINHYYKGIIMMKKYLLALAAVLAFNISARAEEQAAAVQAPVVDQELKKVEKALENAKTPAEKVEILKNLSEEIQKENPVLFAGLTREQKKTYATYVLYALAAAVGGYMAYCTYKYWTINTKPATKTETPKAPEATKTETPKAPETTKTETPKAPEATKTETPKAPEATKTETDKKA